MTAATTLMGRLDFGSGMSSRGSRFALLHVEPEQLLSHEQDVTGCERMLGTQPDEGAVRAAHVGEIHVAVVLARDTAVEPGDVAVFGEEDIASLAAEVDPRLGHREGVAR